MLKENYVIKAERNTWEWINKFRIVVASGRVEGDIKREKQSGGFIFLGDFFFPENMHMEVPRLGVESEL